MQVASVKRQRRAGRPRASEQRREPNGRSQRSVKAERDAALSVVTSARLRQGLAFSLEDATDPLIATPLGRLYRSAEIGKREYDAGEMYASAYRRNAALSGIPAPFPRCPDGTGSSKAEPKAEDIERTRRTWLEANGALGNAGRAALQEVREVAIFESECGSPASLRFGLKALAIHFKLPVDEKEEAA